MRSDPKLAAAVLAAVALLTACGSDSGLGTAPTPVPSPPETVVPVEPTATPSVVVVLAREQAAALYLEIVTPTNDALEALDAVLIRFEEGDYTTESAILEEIRNAALAVEAVRPEEQARLIELQTTAIEGIDPVVWRDAMADLLREFSAGELWYHALTEAKTYQDVYDAAEDFNIEDTGAADVVRAYLGLPTRS